jgi:plastocyanin
MRPAIVVGSLLALGSSVAQRAPAAGTHAITGSIEGRVTFDGSPPPPAIVIQNGGSQPVLYVDRSGGLRDAVVFLPDARPGAAPTAPPATMNQRNFIFEPQVLAVRAGQTVRFTNDDPAAHNVRAQDSNPVNTFSINTASGSVGPDTQVFAPTRADRPLELSCDIHPWMAAWIYVFTHERFAVTEAGGGFRITDVPAGRHRIAVRQPSGRLARDLAVDVRAGETARLDVRFTPADVGMPSR